MSLRTILALTAIEDFNIEQMGAVSAFLNGDLTKGIWVELSHRFHKPLLARLLMRGSMDSSNPQASGLISFVPS